MTAIEIKIEAFGAIERQLPENLMVKCAPSSPVSHIINQIKVLFPETSPMLEQCACAIGEDIVPRYVTLQNSTTLVLLSPVAGG